MMSRTYHLLVLPIFAGFLISTAMTLGVALTVRLAGMATTASTNTICTIIIRIIAFIAHFGCLHLKVGIETFIAISHGSAIIGSTIIGSTIIGSTIIGSTIIGSTISIIFSK